MLYLSDMMGVALNAGLRARLLDRIASDPDAVWTPSDFGDLGSRADVDKMLQRLVPTGELRRIDRGLYDRPRRSRLTGRPTVPDYRAVIRRDQTRAVVDGMTAANDIGLTTAVPGLSALTLWPPRMFFNRTDYDLASAQPPTFALAYHDGMIDALRRDYAAMAAMIVGPAPSRAGAASPWILPLPRDA
jgi:hypothetical protein